MVKEGSLRDLGISNDLIDRGPGESLVLSGIEHYYMGERGLNLQTFRDPEFLRDPISAPTILKEKVEDLPTVLWDPNPDYLTFVDLSLHSILKNLDGDDSMDPTNADAAYAFKFRGNKPLVFQDGPVPQDVAMVVQRSFFYDGCEHVHGFGGDTADELPFVLHPSEMQIIGLTGEGVIIIYLYDQVVHLAPGDKGDFSIEYLYLRHGMRYHRRIDLKVHGVWRARRDAVEYTNYEKHAEPQDLQRIFGLEFNS